MMIGYYVSVIDDDGNAYRMRGPFNSHQEALDRVLSTKRETDLLDPRPHFWAWGTCKLEGADLPPGRLDRMEGRAA